MSIFNLPDLGEGLPEAEIQEWHVKEGDVVKTDQPLVTVETAKAMVDVPAPQDGKIIKLYAQPGEHVQTGSPLVAFEGEGGVIEKEKGASIAGAIEVGETVLQEAATGVSMTATTSSGKVNALPMVRALAKRLKIDITSVSGTGSNGQVTKEDVERAAQGNGGGASLSADYTPLKGTQRTMAQMMVKAHQEVVPVTIFDDADISTWAEGTDISIRIVQAVIAACQVEPKLNAWFDGDALASRLFDDVNLGLAMDAPDGLFVPVLKKVNQQDAATIRSEINRFKHEVRERTIAPADLQGATIVLSNFGVFAGRYASPIVVPPTVAIIGIGRIKHQQMPISLTFDHRPITGGEATRFLKVMLDHLEQA